MVIVIEINFKSCCTYQVFVHISAFSKNRVLLICFCSNISFCSNKQRISLALICTFAFKMTVDGTVVAVHALLQLF